MSATDAVKPYREPPISYDVSGTALHIKRTSSQLRGGGAIESPQLASPPLNRENSILSHRTLKHMIECVRKCWQAWLLRVSYDSECPDQQTDSLLRAAAHCWAGIGTIIGAVEALCRHNGGTLEDNKAQKRNSESQQTI